PDADVLLGPGLVLPAPPRAGAGAAGRRRPGPGPCARPGRTPRGRTAGQRLSRGYRSGNPTTGPASGALLPIMARVLPSPPLRGEGPGARGLTQSPPSALPLRPPSGYKPDSPCQQVRKAPHPVPGRSEEP